jgi:hypothetical protein
MSMQDFFGISLEVSRTKEEAQGSGLRAQGAERRRRLQRDKRKKTFNTLNKMYGRFQV